ncbi:bifunctional 2-polyprenyl-6-hydroxyphenol methylase/3-demethylubiquinol 3-O-methyltransferase UbiG [Bacillus sp. J14TS2]|uniref:class I SAM-dependent methyltransferase n=1 Tax=Bacillus sp. J14TS2 TaxID=2807188 RepID=UPI001BB38DCD|nr:class I SAM-dependent methyltransferase [Bacillus sp. J14TS2]
MKKEKMDKNISSVFDYNGDYYKEIGDFLRENYLNYGYTQGTKQEVDFLVEILEVSRKASILDIGCGPGRHCLEFARRGYNTVGVDISSGFINYANKVATEQNLNSKFFVADARDLHFNQQFEGAICLCEGAFGLAGNEENHRKILKGVYNALTPNGIFVLTVINALSAARNLTDNCEFDTYTCTKIDKEKLISPEGETKEVPVYTTAFTFRELKYLLESEGFEVDAAYGCSAGNFSKKPLTINDIEIMIIAHRK